MADIYIDVIPLQNNIYNYQFNILLQNTRYIFRIFFNERIEKWILDIKDNNNDPILMGIPLLIGASLTKRFVDPRLSNIKQLTMINSINAGGEVTKDNLGINTFLVLYSVK